MTIPRLLEMETYWGNNPPIHDMLAAFFGIKGRGREAPGVKAEDDGARFLNDFIAAGGIVPAEVEREIRDV